MMAIAILLVVWTSLLYIPVKAPFGFAVIVPRLTAGALSPVLAIAGAIGTAVALWTGAYAAAVCFAGSCVLAFNGARRIATARGDVTDAFGPLHPRRRSFKTATGARWERDVPFWTIPGADRTLLCDIWQPPVGVKPSGLAYIYFHGSAWYIFDKDAYTRTIFRRLAAQGHLVMDVAYRLYPEADVPGMVGDVKRAVAWLKEHAADYGVDPDRIVIGGSSAGGHMVQLAGFAPDHPEFTPSDVRGRDLTVRGIISCYGPSDLTVCYQHTNQHRIPGVGVTPPDLTWLNTPAPAWMGRHLGRMRLHRASMAGRLDWLMGGTPDQVPERYALCSPINHVHPGCPPTLLLQGEDDLITSATATRTLFSKLREAGVPAKSVIFPYTEHGFDLVFPAWSPSGQGALQEVERFLARLAAD